MLPITIPAREFFDEAKQEFIYTQEYKLQLEHSLASLSKWEEKWKKPFFKKGEKTLEETIDYIRCMCLDPDVPPEVFYYVTNKNMTDISAYIEDSMTATTFYEPDGKKRNNEQITAELIYYWMLSLEIPFDREYWHLNKLLTLIRVTSLKNAPPKKMSAKEATKYYAKLNEERRKALNSKG